MGTKLNAVEMRLKTVAAKKLKSAISDSEHTSNNSGHEFELENAFGKQRTSILLAASEGLSELVTTRVVYLKRLLELGLQVVETGTVSKKFEEVTPDPAKVASFKKELTALLNVFLKASRHDLADYYGGYKVFSEVNHLMLDQAMQRAAYESDYTGYDLFLDPLILLNNRLSFQIDPYLLEDYADQLGLLNLKMKEYAGYLRQVTEENFKALDKPIEYIKGMYVFDESDDEDFIEPSSKGNKLLIRWDSDEVSTHLKKPIFSVAGLTWLSTFRGQTLLDVLLGCIEADATEGKETCCLTFANNNGWYFADSEKKTPSCDPKELKEILVSKGFKVSVKKLDGQRVQLLVSW